ncbi:hypothetical protein PN36_16305 [Candidatus Thiomargarita nelsonii]|uniref:Uncharacterized protein n=1 Tax=Candidatus Thiomargarita nelsonii TaxID=1003181 RepID=A0A0A6P4X8_9GAMM|nr:hypothetical protein PN36_16305 [Candidatus Thiomargarita nelsonii]
MIPVAAQPEPSHFSKQVRNPGQQFLSKVQKPTSQQWRGKEYWQRALPDMRIAYNSICAYSAFWIPHSTGNQPKPALSSNQKDKLWETIKHLKLNDDEDLVIERQTWYLNYLNKEISFEHLKKKAPFIALEAERQNLV